MTTPFDVPTPTAPPGDLLVRPARFRAWIDSLPSTTSFDSSRKLLAHAQALAGTVLDSDTRLELLEIHARAAATMLPALESFYADSGPPLEPAARSAVGLVRDYTSALIVGYRRVAADAAGKLLGSRKAVGIALRRGMHFACLRMIA